MDITIHSTFLPHDNTDASLAFYRDTPDTSNVLHRPAADPASPATSAAPSPR